MIYRKYIFLAIALLSSNVICASEKDDKKEYKFKDEPLIIFADDGRVGGDDKTIDNFCSKLQPSNQAEKQLVEDIRLRNHLLYDAVGKKTKPFEKPEWTCQVLITMLASNYANLNSLNCNSSYRMPMLEENCKHYEKQIITQDKDVRTLMTLVEKNNIELELLQAKKQAELDAEKAIQMAEIEAERTVKIAELEASKAEATKKNAELEEQSINERKLIRLKSCRENLSLIKAADEISLNTFSSLIDDYTAAVASKNIRYAQSIRTEIQKKPTLAIKNADGFCFQLQQYTENESNTTARINSLNSRIMKADTDFNIIKDLAEKEAIWAP